MASSFAYLTWLRRWNKTETLAGLSQDGPEVEAVNFMGILKFRLDQDEDVAAIVNAARQFANMVEKAKRDYDEGLKGVEGGQIR